MTVEQMGRSHQQTRGLFLETLFEVTSALGTVGLSTGITSTLSTAGKLIITMIMFVRRLTLLTKERRIDDNL